MPIDSVRVISYSNNSLEYPTFTIDKTNKLIISETKHFSDFVISSPDSLTFIDSREVMELMITVFRLFLAAPVLAMVLSATLAKAVIGGALKSTIAILYGSGLLASIVTQSVGPTK